MHGVFQRMNIHWRNVCGITDIQLSLPVNGTWGDEARGRRDHGLRLIRAVGQQVGPSGGYFTPYKNPKLKDGLQEKIIHASGE